MAYSGWLPLGSVYAFFACHLQLFYVRASIPAWTPQDKLIMAQKVKAMFQHAYDPYMKYAFPVGSNSQLEWFLFCYLFSCLQIRTYKPADL